MKFLYILFFFYFSSCLYGQKSNINFDEIKTQVKDSSSKYFYERLVFRFRYNPTMLDSLEMKHLYYGKFYTKYKSNPINLDKVDFLKNFKSTDDAVNLKIGNELLYKDPTDLEILAIMLQVYSKGKDDSEEFGLRAMQLRKLLETILKSGSMEDQNLAFTVMSIPDEYVLAGFLKIDLNTYKRASKMTDDATFDKWKNGNKYLIFKVIKDFE
jgi:hypothetical protein